MSSDETKAQLAEAKALIQQKRYADARKVLKRINDPVARQWETKLDSVAPPAPAASRSALNYAIVGIVGGIIGLLIGLVIGSSLGSRSAAASVAVLPTVASTPTVDVSATQLSFVVATNNSMATSLAITQTAAANFTSIPTIIPSLTFTPTITNTPLPTPTRIPTNTPLPPQIGKLGPLYDDIYDETYNIEIRLNSVSYRSAADYQKPSPGNVYAIANVTVRNLGPGTLRSISNFSFQSKDGKGAIRQAELFVFSDCQFDSVDLTANGSVDGCIAFEIPIKDTVEIIYAPFQYEALKEGRYISFKIQ